MLNNTHLWLGGYVKNLIDRGLRPRPWAKPTHIMFCFVDHFEPDWNKAPIELQQKRVETWLRNYPILADRHKDSDGVSPKHTFFYPAEVYVGEHLENLAKIFRQGFGEVEIHLHHDNDTAGGLRQKLMQAKIDFQRHGLLGKDKNSGETRFAFIHGNWCLNNSRKDGRWCGVNNETSILAECGCYADFTFPSAPSDTQPSIINSIYYPSGDESRPKSHNTGIPITLGASRNVDRPVIIQGPLTLNWQRRKYGLIPKIENGDVTGVNPPTPERVKLWVDQRIGVAGRPEWVFIKVHTHGGQENNFNMLLNGGLENLWSHLESKYNDEKNFVLHYVSAREMYNMIKAAEAGEQGPPNNFRDYLIIKNF